MKHLKTSQQLNEASENLNISDVINRIFKEIKFEQRIIHKNSEGKVSSDFIEGFSNCIELLKTIIEQETGIKVESDEISKKYGL